ncbi:hypothetical protein HY57_08240 [Dyella japonica A8]|uniref:Uncharacterized protein n=2 Tax=Dyella japonica TaxID=231455 RepID=A0A075JYU2_9GAMM|nr:hypothetical protein HY57_08240 [Dyella japonica A8]
MRGLAVAILAAVAFVYLPVIHGKFLWDDWPSFRDLQGEQWLHYVFRDFNRWNLYFRPLTVAFFAFQIKLFHSQPEPMHVVLLVIHLINVSLVGVLANRIGYLKEATESRRSWTALVCMLVYGLHPALIESVSWIGCQFDQITTMVTLCGLITNAYIQRPILRAGALSFIFFVAACCKEAASVFPLLVVLFDWALFAQNGERTPQAIIGTVLRRNWRAYAAMLACGIAYLGLRHWALGEVNYLQSSATTAWFARFQEICFVYMRYLRILVWPIAGMGPLHPVDVTQFRYATATSILNDLATLSIVAGGLYLAVRRGSPLGFVILAVTGALLPVLHILPVVFERSSLFHERYATMALAVGCAMLPLLKWPRIAAFSKGTTGMARLLGPAVLFLWLMFAIIDIRTIVPNWANDIALWRWAIALDHHSLLAKDYLLMAYEDSGDIDSALSFGDQLLAEPVTCTSCMLHFAKIALNKNDTARAAAALEKASRSTLVRASPEARQLYLSELGQWLNMQGRHDDARQAFEAALALKPDDNDAKRGLAQANAFIHDAKQMP